MNKNLDSLTEYPFYFLRELLSTVENNAEETLGLHIGEPKSIPPKEALNLLNNHSDLYSKYPTSKGEYFLRESYCNWLKARYGVKTIDSDKNVLPIAGSREGIFSFIQAGEQRISNWQSFHIFSGISLKLGLKLFSSKEFT